MERVPISDSPVPRFNRLAECAMKSGCMSGDMRKFCRMYAQQNVGTPHISVSSLYCSGIFSQNRRECAHAHACREGNAHICKPGGMLCRDQQSQEVSRLGSVLWAVFIMARATHNAVFRTNQLAYDRSHWGAHDGCGCMGTCAVIFRGSN